MSIFDDVCPIGPDGVCERHKIIHRNRYHSISQDTTSVGHFYRKKWDEEFKDVDTCGEICEIKDGICTKHKVAHEGRHYNFSQEKTERGFKVRLQWNKIKSNKKTNKGCGCNKQKGKLT